MYKNGVVLCGSSAYEGKYYFNEKFSGLPQGVQEELQVICVLFTEEIGGILTFCFEENGTLMLQVQADDNDFWYDEIGSVLKIKQLQEEKKELLESLELYYRVFFLKEDASQLLSKA